MTMAEKWKGVPYKIPEDPAPTQAEIEALLDTNIEGRLSERDLKLLMAQIAHDSMSEEENVAEIERETREIAEEKRRQEIAKFPKPFVSEAKTRWPASGMITRQTAEPPLAGPSWEAILAQEPSSGLPGNQSERDFTDSAISLLTIHKRRYLRDMVPVGQMNPHELEFWDRKATDYALDATKRELDAVGGILEDLTPNHPRIRQFVDDLRYGESE